MKLLLLQSLALDAQAVADELLRLRKLKSKLKLKLKLRSKLPKLL